MLDKDDAAEQIQGGCRCASIQEKIVLFLPFYDGWRYTYVYNLSVYSRFVGRLMLVGDKDHEV